MNKRILLVEDEETIQDALKLNLELENYEVVGVEDGMSGLKKLQEERFDLIILDVMLPEIDGFQVCEQIRLEDLKTPILFLTAKDSSQDVVNGFRKGADDYLVKPFNLEELLLRVKVLLRRSTKENDSPGHQSYRFGENLINFVTFEATGLKGNFMLTKKEVKLLKLLIDRKNEVVSRQSILQYVWGYDVYPSTRTIDNFILSFRKYFEKDPKEPKYFHSVRGVGYKFTE